jgi:hypothetical protein
LYNTFLRFCTSMFTYFIPGNFLSFLLKATILCDISHSYTYVIFFYVLKLHLFKIFCN